MEERSGLLRYLAVAMLVIGLIAGSFGSVAAEDDQSTTTDTTSETTTDTTSETTTETTTDTTSDTTTDTTSDTTTDTTSETTTDTTTETTSETTTDTTSDETSGTESTDIGIFAISPENTMGPNDDLAISFPDGVTFGDLTVVSANLSDILEGTCKLGSPRFTFGLDSNDDGTTDGYVPVYLANFPGFTGCDGDSRVHGENVVGATDARWDTGAFGGGYVSWADAEALVGDFAVTDVLFVVEYGQVTVTPEDLVVVFKTPTDPGTAYGTVTVNTTFGGDLPVDEACFTLTRVGDEVVGDPLCIGNSDLVERVGSVTFQNVTAGDYIVTQSTVPTNFSGNDPVPVTVESGYDATVAMTNDVLPTTLTVTSAYPELGNVVPAGTSVSLWIGNVEITDAEDPWFPEATTLPSTHTAEMSIWTPSPWRIVIDAEGFQPYDNTFEVEPGGSYDIVLVPDTAFSDVTINIASLAPDINNVVPAGATWSISQGETVLDSGELEEALELPADPIVLEDVPYGTYTVAVDASPDFLPYSKTFTVDQPTETADVILAPADAVSTVTVAISSLDPAVRDTLPAGSTWTVSLDGVELDGGTFDEAVELPTELDVNNPVPYGTYTVTLDTNNAFADYSAEVTIDSTTQTVEIELDPQTFEEQLIRTLIEILQKILADTGSGAGT